MYESIPLVPAPTRPVILVVRGEVTYKQVLGAIFSDKVLPLDGEDRKKIIFNFFMVTKGHLGASGYAVCGISDEDFEIIGDVLSDDDVFVIVDRDRNPYANLSSYMRDTYKEFRRSFNTYSQIRLLFDHLFHLESEHREKPVELSSLRFINSLTMLDVTPNRLHYIVREGLTEYAEILESDRDGVSVKEDQPNFLLLHALFCKEKLTEKEDVSF